MNKKILLAMAAMLGFSTACSTVKNTSKGAENPKKEIDTMANPANTDKNIRISVMYGVRTPIDDSKKKEKLEVFEAPKGQKPSNPRYEVDPVAEKPRD